MFIMPTSCIPLSSYIALVIYDNNLLVILMQRENKTQTELVYFYTDWSFQTYFPLMQDTAEYFNWDFYGSILTICSPLPVS